MKFNKQIPRLCSVHFNNYTIVFGKKLKSRGDTKLLFAQTVQNNNAHIDKIDSSSDEDESSSKRALFPFTAIIGQDEMKLALLLNVIDPKIGGVMIMGDRGTGKSTTVRSLVDLLPEIEVVEDDPFNSHPTDPELMSEEIRQKVSASTEPYPEQNNSETEEVDFSPKHVFPHKTKYKKIDMVDLPLGATEDRVCGTIDIEKALSEGTKAFEPGLLAKANRGILYVDEVNLLDDHLVDILLDAAASGWNTVEREGISMTHPARFILIGSGNPEEGELRPQLLDRFGMHAQIGTVTDPEARVNIVEQRTQFDENPIEFRSYWEDSQQALKEKIENARNIVSTVTIDYDLRVGISQVCSELQVDGLRGDIVVNRAAKALAALENQTLVNSNHIQSVITLCLRHRLRKDPLETIDSGTKVQEAFNKVFG